MKWGRGGKKKKKRRKRDFFFFKQKTAYEIYQCDWSSDVCSSDLQDNWGGRRGGSVLQSKSSTRRSALRRGSSSEPQLLANSASGPISTWQLRCPPPTLRVGELQVEPPTSSWASADALALCMLKEIVIASPSYTGWGAAETCAVETSDKLMAKITLTIMRNIALHNIFGLSNEVGVIHNQFNTILLKVNSVYPWNNSFCFCLLTRYK